VLDAARQFEALLVAQLLRAARGDGAGWLGTGEDHSSTPAMELAEEQLAAALAAQGGLGLARLIASGLKQP
jgi:Rod binding domain-containing protein